MRVSAAATDRNHGRRNVGTHRAVTAATVRKDDAATTLVERAEVPKKIDQVRLNDGHREVE